MSELGVRNLFLVFLLVSLLIPTPILLTFDSSIGCCRMDSLVLCSVRSFRGVVSQPRPEDQVPVIGHDAIAAKPHVVTGDAVGKYGPECLEILLLFEDAETAVGTIQCVIDDITLGNTLRSTH